jgi:hypothetical protein
MKKVLIYALLMGLGFIGAPLATAIVIESTSSKSSIPNADTMTMRELLNSEQDAIASHESNVEMLAVSSAVGMIGGALAATAISGRTKK